MKLVQTSDDLYAKYRSHMQKIADVKNAVAVLQWDQETYLPPDGASFRGQQMATLSELAHGFFTDKKFGDLLNELSSRTDLSPVMQKNVQLSREDYLRQKKFTGKFIRALSEAVSHGFHAWMDARKKNSFAFFESDLNKILVLKKEEAERVGYAGHPYDALAEEFEKGCTVVMLDKLFNGIREPLKQLLDRIASSTQIDDSFLHAHYPKQEQWELGLQIIRQLGFNFEAGRQDLSEHPFTTSFNPNDVRITTRVDENDFGNMLWSCIHEAGHGLYEQGLPGSEYGLPSGEYASLGIHESQSRLWENNIGRSADFWQFQFARLKESFPKQLEGITTDGFYKGINKVEPSQIRTEADETTYHFHVIIRYELEKLLIGDQIAVHDVPSYWNEQYEKYLGVKVTDDKRGCLQDVHWSHGSFGYFPTYSLGSFYAAQFFAAMQVKYPDLMDQVKTGDTKPVLVWLRSGIHQFGRLYTSEELCLQATGKTLDIQYFLDYLLDKYRNIYNFCI